MTDSKLSIQDVFTITNRLPFAVQKVMMDPVLRAVLAGGYIRDIITGVEPKDIDLFARTEQHAQEIASDIAAAWGVQWTRTKNAYSIKKDGEPTVQVIHRWVFSEPEDVVKSFDFTICQAVVWYDEMGWRSYADPAFEADARAKRLSYTAPDRLEDAGGSALRVLRFVSRGYSIEPSEYAKVMARVTSNGDRAEEAVWTETLRSRLRDAYMTPVV